MTINSLENYFAACFLSHKNDPERGGKGWEWVGKGLEERTRDLFFCNEASASQLTVSNLDLHANLDFEIT